VASYTEILAKAREHDLTISRRMRGWAVEVHSGKSVLMSYWYNDAEEVSAFAVYIDEVGDGQLEMIAGHINEQNGSGPLTLDALKKLHGSKAKSAGKRKVAAEVIKDGKRTIN
jgi:hypothetical protein